MTALPDYLTSLKSSLEEAGFDIFQPFPTCAYNNDPSRNPVSCPDLPTFGRGSPVSVLVGNTSHLWPSFLSDLRLRRQHGGTKATPHGSALEAGAPPAETPLDGFKDRIQTKDEERSTSCHDGVAPKASTPSAAAITASVDANPTPSVEASTSSANPLDGCTRRTFVNGLAHAPHDGASLEVSTLSLEARYPPSARPLDDYTERTLTKVLAGAPHSSQVLFVHTQPGKPGFVGAALAATVSGLAHSNRALFFSIHPQFGPWFAMRAIICFDADLQLLPVPVLQDCVPEAALQHLLELMQKPREPAATGSSWRHWLKVREAIGAAVGAESHRYPDDMMEYHYTTNLSLLN